MVSSPVARWHRFEGGWRTPPSRIDRALLAWL